MSDATQTAPAPTRPRVLHPLTIVLVLIVFAAILADMLRPQDNAVGLVFILSCHFLILLSVGFTSELLLRRRTRPWLFRLVALAIVAAVAAGYLLVPFEGQPRWLVDLPTALGVGCAGYLYLYLCSVFVQNAWQSWTRK